MTDCVRVSEVRRVLASGVARVLPRSGQRAAVAVVLRDGPTGAEVLLIERSRRADDPWSGHVAFPGGRREASDADDLATAVRETEEEIGLDVTRQARLLGRLDELCAMAQGRRLDMVIAPFVFELIEPSTLCTNDEVSDVFWAPLAPLLSGEANVNYRVESDVLVAEHAAYKVNDRIVWGLTQRMLSCLVGSLASGASTGQSAGDPRGKYRD